MKRILIISILVKAIMLPVACTSSSNTTASTNQIVSSGTWRVTLFTDSGTDETSNFSGYEFAFSSNGTIITTKGSTIKNGTWSVSTSSNKFNIDLGVKDNTNKPLGDLTNDWRIISTTETEIKLKDDNTTSNEFVTFTKN